MKKVKALWKRKKKTNSYTCILRRYHDQQESREGTSQRRLFYHRYPMMFNGYYYKCNNYGHNASHCRAHDKSRQEEIKVGFPFSVTIAIIMVISQNISGCRDKLEFGEEIKINQMM